MRRAVSACRRPPPRGSAAGRSAARVVADREAQRPGGGLVVEVVARALEPGRGDEEPENGGLVRRILALLGPVGGDQALDRRERGLVGHEPAAGERAVLLQLL